VILTLLGITIINFILVLISPAAGPVRGGAALRLLSVLHPANEATTAWLQALTVGLSARHLRRGGPLLRSLSHAVFPIYVLHFPSPSWISPWQRS
jgi:hypothetical protein